MLNQGKTSQQPQNPANFRDLFLEQGYLLLKGVLDPRRDLEPLTGAYSDLIDKLIKQELGDSLQKVIPEYEAMDFPRRFASLVAITNGSVFDHLDPALNVYERGYRRWKNTPSAQSVELFGLISNPRVLDVVEKLIGPEIWATPGYHLNIKLPDSHLEEMRRAKAGARKTGTFKKFVLGPSQFIENFQMHSTPWHYDGYPGMGMEFEHQYITVWIPLTPAGAKNGGLAVLPRSHLNGYCEFPLEREDEALVLETQPGDLVILSDKMFHSSTPNRSKDSFRWSFNMRYIPVGQRIGRHFLPGFVARSRKNPESEFRDAERWISYWEAALDYLSRYELPLPHFIRLSIAQVDRMDQYWKKLVPDQESWLDLHLHGSRLRAIKCSLLKTIDRLHGYVLASIAKVKERR